MDKNQLLKSLSDNVIELGSVENEIAMTRLAIYQKSIDQLKKFRTDDVKRLFEEQAKVYGQNSSAYQVEIDKNITKYHNQMDKLVEAYDQLYLNVFKVMQEALNNQKVAVGSIAIVLGKMQKEGISEEEKRSLQNTMTAYAEKKLNYAVIVEECNARLDWCIQNAQKDIDELFKENQAEMQVYEGNIFDKIRRKLVNLFNGKNSYKTFIKQYEIDRIGNIKKANKAKIFCVASTLGGVMKQMEMANAQIAQKFAERQGASI